jgi:predicted small secreted protein
MKRKSTAILLVLAITALLAGCGGSSGGSGVSAGAYVKSICSAVGPFEKDVASRSSALSSLTSVSPSQGKQALQGFLSAVVSDTDKAVNKLKSAGTPNVSKGKQIANTLVKAFTELKTALQGAQKQASSLPTTSPTAFKNAAQALGTSIQSSMSAIGSSLNNLKSPDLEKAASKEPTCKSIGSG